MICLHAMEKVAVTYFQIFNVALYFSALRFYTINGCYRKESWERKEVKKDVAFTFKKIDFENPRTLMTLVEKN